MSVNNEDNIYFNFSYLALKLLGKGLYSNPWAALSELIANSIDAGAKNVYLLFNLADKKNATIEIFDNGSGMDYNDLAKKYVWVGRNKREDPFEEKKDNYMGRKGIGKLATLYLSNNYYIFSKKSANIESWNLNIKNSLDTDTPHLKKVNIANVDLKCKDMFESFKSGTYIKLNNVDLTNLGDKKIEGLKARFSNFFITQGIKTSIELCVIDEENVNIKFEKVEKKIAFKNLCAVFSNEFDIDKEISEEVMFDTTTDISEIKYQKYPVAKLKNSDFNNLSGIYEYADGDKIIKKQYVLKGWIGIHTSITSNFSKINDDRFIRNETYTPNKLRLYVRNKLAVDNLLDILHNTQAFSNYIEGEISFDLLDDDELEDIATSNRQGYNEIDGRMELLKDIVYPIVNSLIHARLKFSSIIKNQIDEYHIAEKKQKDERIKLEKEAKERALEAARTIGEKLKVTQRKLNKEKRLNEQLTKVSNLKNRDTINVIHTIFNHSVLIKKEFDKLPKFYGKFNGKELKIFHKISKLNLENLYLSKGVTKSHMIIGYDVVHLNLYEFAVDYINNVLTKIYDDRLSIKCELNCDNFFVDIKPIHFSSILENLISNSYKSNARNVILKFYDDNSNVKIDVEDDGSGISEEIDEINDIFKFGFTTTNGSGIGLFYIKNYILDSNGTIDVVKEYTEGMKFTISWAKKV